MTATDTSVFSYSIVIRDMFLAKLVAAPFFADFTFRKSRQLPAQSAGIDGKALLASMAKLR